ncbi:MAG TPA: hypothetical protein VJ570_12665, partial [Holophagaceae bacterium]|nr:hypothetical protein [Holophagaceae bacterium]
PVHVIQNQPGSATTLYAGTDFGVYRSLDGGTTWARFGSGMPLVATRDLYLAPDGSFIRAATFGRGVWEIAGGPALALSLTESGPLQVAPGGSLQVHGTLSNATDPNITWTTVPAATGSFSPSTTLSGAATTWTSPGTPQVVSLVATSVQNSAVTATIQANVYDPASMSVAVSPTPVIVVSGDTQQFTATPSNAPGNGVTWSLTGTGTLSGTGFFTAPTLGTGTAPVTITATSVYPGVAGAPVAGSASVTVKSLDLNGDAAVDFQDMAFLAKAFGTATPAAKLTNASATVDTNDITKFIALF